MLALIFEPITMASPARFKKNARAGRTYLSPSREGARLHISYSRGHQTRLPKSHRLAISFR